MGVCMDVSDLIRQLYETKFNCQQAIERAAKKRQARNAPSHEKEQTDLVIRIGGFETSVVSRIQKTPLHETLDNILLSDTWGKCSYKDNRGLLPLTLIGNRSPREKAEFIYHDANILIDFLDRATWEQAPLKVIRNEDFIFEIKRVVDQLKKESDVILERANLSRSGKIGGGANKKKLPVQEAINEFLQKRPRYWKGTNEYIAEEFCRLNQEKRPFTVRIGEDFFDVYSDREHENIFFKVSLSPIRAKRESDAKSVAKSTFIQRYVPEAKKNLSPAK